MLLEVLIITPFLVPLLVSWVCLLLLLLLLLVILLVILLLLLIHVASRDVGCQDGDKEDETGSVDDRVGDDVMKSEDEDEKGAEEEGRKEEKEEISDGDIPNATARLDMFRGAALMLLCENMGRIVCYFSPLSTVSCQINKVCPRKQCSLDRRLVRRL